MCEVSGIGSELLRSLKWKVGQIDWVIDDLKKISELNKRTSLMIAKAKGNILDSLSDVKERVDRKIDQLEKLEPNQLLTDKELLDCSFNVEVELRERGEIK